MADAQDSKSCEGNFMWVQVPPSAPDKVVTKDVTIFLFFKTGFLSIKTTLVITFIL